MKNLRVRLSRIGVKKGVLDDVLPDWWEDTLADTPAGFREGAGYICARLRLSLASLLDAEKPLAFPSGKTVKYKKNQGATDEAVALATHYALGVANTVAAAFVDKPAASAVPVPEELRKNLLKLSDRPWVCLRHIISVAWKLGIPVIHLKNLPKGVKKPTALTTMVDGRPIIVVFSGKKRPSWMAFIIAHELGHIHCGHLKAGETLVDENVETKGGDKEEGEANDFAARLLTGQSNLGLHSSCHLYPNTLASLAEKFGETHGIAPGVAALNYGFTTGLWVVANGAVKLLEGKDNAADDLKKALENQLNPDDLPEESWEWIQRVSVAV